MSGRGECPTTRWDLLHSGQMKSELELMECIGNYPCGTKTGPHSIEISYDGLFSCAVASLKKANEQLTAYIVPVPILTGIPDRELS
jgi:hypothetical protein